MTHATDFPVPVGDLVGPVIRDLARRSGRDLTRWLDQVHRLGGCREPLRLTGHRTTIDGNTGEVLTRYSTKAEPHGQLLIRCGNRRASRCPACAETYRRDTFHLIRSGLLGGDKGVPESVRAHPRVLATLTAPSFGPVHRGPGKDGKTIVCHPRRTGPACFTWHKTGDQRIGQPLDQETYDYAGHVLWNAHAGDLWRRFTIYLRRHMAAAAGLTRKAFNNLVRLSFAKVAEYQTRGVVHFHAVIRLDGRSCGGMLVSPPAWATVELLSGAIRSAVAAVRVDVPEYGPLTWGQQVDVATISPGALGQGTALSERAVAGYVAKYATKSAETSGTLDRAIKIHEIPRLHTMGIPDHTIRLIRTAWRLGNALARPDLAHLRLRDWAHMLGFRGHFSTRSRAYSTTLGALRQARVDYRLTQRADHERAFDPGTTLVLAHWKFAGQGYTPGEFALASGLSSGLSHDPSPECPSLASVSPDGSDRYEITNEEA
ncbi:replication initiator protein RepSA [Acrocarpospora macrocephala]|uniref:Replication initiation protein n=1 Tax=Acrocarpospora macrocephala TaxID=150177 RepID=A0A5M3WLZ8_9ACTN|nr:replication initiator [Acrocarpospora macrocephala]GES07943.1 replication initiation protein [Acrocarpospora macrocephala]